MIKAATLVSSTSRSAGGLFYTVRRLTQSLSQGRGVDMDVLGLEDPFSGADRAEWAPVSPRVFRALGPRAYGYSPGLRRALMDGDYALVHSHGIWTYTSHAALQWWRRNRRPHLVSTHGMLDPWALRNAAWKKAIASALYQREHLERASCLHSLCASETRSMRALGLSQPICEIPNGVDLPEDGPAGPAPWAGQVKEGQRVLFYLGRLHAKKGLPALVEAFARVQQSGGARGWRLAIAGWDQGGHEEQLKQIAGRHRLEAPVIFTGPLFGRAKADAFRAADAFILPSHSEGLPVAVLEAWSFGLPVLMTPECNLPEGFSAGAAVQIATGTAALEPALAQFFAGDPGQQREMGRQGLALAKRRFSWDSISRDMAAVYRWLLEGGPAPACIVP